MVMVYHFYETAFGTNFLPWNGDWPDWSAIIWKSFHWLYFLRLGASGVILFFVLSGFCIHHSFLQRASRQSALSIPEFYWHRFFRIYPPYLISLLAFIFLSQKYDLINISAHLTFIHSLFNDKNILFGYSASYWTLPVEFHLYLIYPLFLVVYRKMSMAWALSMTLIISTIFNYFILPSSLFNVYKLPFYFWFYWAIGAYVADVRYKGNQAFKRHGLFILLLLPLWIFTVYYRPLSRFLWPIGAVLSAVLTDYMAGIELKKTPITSLLSAIGLISYSIYLWHQPLFWSISKNLLSAFSMQRTPMVMFGICLPVVFAIVFGLSWLSYTFLEMRSVDLGKKLWHSSLGWRSSILRQL